jgi:hypothetical protein
MKRTLITAALTTLSCAALAQTADTEPTSAATRLQAVKVDKDTLTFNMESVGKLLESSSAARQIDSSKASEAIDKRQKAREIYKSAQAALAAGDLNKASQLLTEVRSLFFEAVRLAAPEEVTAKKLENDYKARLESVNALLGAYKRVANEKGSAAKGVNETVAQIDKGVAEAAKLAQAGKFKEGRSELDRVYLVAKAGISGLRSGDTLVRSLNFASKEEEYHYEIDRNNTHHMLIEVLLADKKADGMVQQFIDKAKALRTQAEAAASSKDYANGVKLLEESTAELVRAIRGAGIYIPG